MIVPPPLSCPVFGDENGATASEVTGSIGLDLRHATATRRKNPPGLQGPDLTVKTVLVCLFRFMVKIDLFSLFG